MHFLHILTSFPSLKKNGTFNFIFIFFTARKYRFSRTAIYRYIGILILLITCPSCETPGSKPLVISPLPILKAETVNKPGKMWIDIKNTAQTQESAIKIQNLVPSLKLLVEEEYRHQGWQLLSSPGEIDDNTVKLSLDLQKFRLDIAPESTRDTMQLEIITQMNIQKNRWERQQKIRRTATQEVFIKAQNAHVTKFVEEILAKYASQIAATDISPQ
ncbi:MAG: hypothetical protein AAGB12_00700 [Pseudomonadota bacterium]